MICFPLAKSPEPFPAAEANIDVAHWVNRKEAIVAVLNFTSSNRYRLLPMVEFVMGRKIHKSNNNRRKILQLAMANIAKQFLPAAVVVASRILKYATNFHVSCFMEFFYMSRSLSSERWFITIWENLMFRSRLSFGILLCLLPSIHVSLFEFIAFSCASVAACVALLCINFHRIMRCCSTCFLPSSPTSTAATKDETKA